MTGINPMPRHQAVGNILRTYKHLYAREWSITDCEHLAGEAYLSLEALGVGYDEIVEALQIQRRGEER